MLDMTVAVAFGLTEERHGSDATWMETRAVKHQGGWLINGEKMWTSGYHHATHVLVYARTSGKDGSPLGITCFIVPVSTPGIKAEEYLYTFNMPTDHPRVSLKDVWVPADSFLGPFDDGVRLIDLILSTVHI